LGNLDIKRCTVVDNEIDTLDIDTSAEEVSCDKKTGAVGLEEVVVFDSLLLFELGVDTDRVE